MILYYYYTPSKTEINSFYHSNWIHFILSRLTQVLSFMWCLKDLTTDNQSIFLSENLQSTRFSEVTSDKVTQLLGCGIHQEQMTTAVGYDLWRIHQHIGTGMSDMINLPKTTEHRMCSIISSPLPTSAHKLYIFSS